MTEAATTLAVGQRVQIERHLGITDESEGPGITHYSPEVLTCTRGTVIRAPEPVGTDDESAPYNCEGYKVLVRTDGESAESKYFYLSESWILSNPYGSDPVVATKYDDAPHYGRERDRDWGTDDLYLDLVVPLTTD